MSLLNHKFDNEYAIELSAWGGGTVCDAAFSSHFPAVQQLCAEYKQEYLADPTSISLFIEDCRAHGLDYGFDAIDVAFLEQMDTLKELILPDTITQIEMTPKLSKILKKNRTLIRGSLDSFAERFAHDNGLHYRPSDFVFARSYFELAHESNWVTMIFRRDGSVYIKESTSSPGSSAGNCFGFDWTVDLPHDFYKTMTIEQIADQMHCNGLYREILENGKLAAFFEKAKTHDIFWGKNV